MNYAESNALYPKRPNVNPILEISYTSDYDLDFEAANHKAGLNQKTTPIGHGWHHVDDYGPVTSKGTMQLVEQPAHSGIPHIGGVSQYKAATGKTYVHPASKKEWKIFMLIPLSDTEKAISCADLDFLEEVLGGRLPPEFRRLYLSSNGGYIGDAQGGNDLLLTGFVPIKYGRIPMDIAYRELVEDFPQMKGRVPFAFDEGGNYFLLTLSGEEQGEVGLWIMDTEEYHVVADAFPEFLSRLNQ
ncbi:SMI1/KNR4 family protein [Pseudomonas putida]|uniref:SMI1/KNR4 family protein n=1 Tax=Pseudomonas putida TaxID=303 RepID=UPI001E5E0CBB|nr:SMI1/KNR4 family protein [Pseudomonas putida]